MTDNTLRSDLEAAAAETDSSATPEKPKPFDAGAAMTRVQEAMANWQANSELFEAAKRAYPRVQIAFESGEIEGVITRGLAKMFAFGANQSGGWVRFFSGNPLEDMLYLDRELRDQEQSGHINAREQRHIARDRQLAAASNLIGALAEIKRGVTRH